MVPTSALLLRDRKQIVKTGLAHDCSRILSLDSMSRTSKEKDESGRITYFGNPCILQPTSITWNIRAVTFQAGAIALCSKRV